MARKSLPVAATRLYSKRGDTDCAICCLAMLLHLHPNEILIAASRVRRQVVEDGLKMIDLVKVAARCGEQAIWTRSFNHEEDDGILWVQYRDSDKRHAVMLSDGKVYDPDYDPIAMWEFDDFVRFWNVRTEDLQLLKLQE